jgi:hypothetical protein
MVGGKIIETTGGEYNIFAEEDIITRSAKSVSETGEENGVEYSNNPASPPVIARISTNCMVEFRTKQDGTYTGQFGFDWLRVDDNTLTREAKYYDCLVNGYEAPNGRAPHRDANTQYETKDEAFKALKKEYKNIPVRVPVTTPVTPPKDYFVPYLNLFSEPFSRASVVPTGMPPPPFEAELRTLIEVSGTDEPDQVRVVFDKRYFEVNGRNGDDANPVLLDKTIGAKRNGATILIKCIADFDSYQEIKVYNYPKGTLARPLPEQLAKRELAGKIIVGANKNTTGQGAIKNVKKQKFVLVNVRTNIAGNPITSSFTPTEKINLYNALHQALVIGDIEDYTNSLGINEFDLSNVNEFTIQTVGTTKVYGKFIYEKLRHDALFASLPGFDPTKTSDGGLFEDYPNPNAPNQEMFTFLRNRFLAQPGNQAKFANHYTVFCFGTIPYDMVLFPSGGYSGTLGQIQAIGTKNACLFLPRNNYTLNHEVLHGLGLHHTHDTPPFTKDVKFTFTQFTTTNIMSYANAANPSNTKTTTWRWQWKIMKSKIL